MQSQQQEHIATVMHVADIVTTAFRSLDLHYPEVTKQQKEALKEAKRQLEGE